MGVLWQLHNKFSTVEFSEQRRLRYEQKWFQVNDVLSVAMVILLRWKLEKYK